MDVTLRLISSDDIEVLFAIHTDQQAQHRAGVGSSSTSRDEFEARLLMQGGLALGVLTRAIWFNGKLVGYIGSLIRNDKREIFYWLDRSVWGKGVATIALRLFLPLLQDRYPLTDLYARVMTANVASSKVLIKCGFTEVGRDRFFSDVHQKDVEETLYKL